MDKKIKKIAIFVDSRKESGGAYQELLYSIKNIKKYNKDNLKFSLICTSKKLNLKLEDENLDTYYFSLNNFERYICYLRNFDQFFRRLKKYFFFQNKFENFLKKNNFDLVYFTQPSQYSLYLEDAKFFITVPDVNHREDVEFPEFVNSGEFHRKDEIFQKALPRALAVITNAEIVKKRISFFYGILEDRIHVINHQPSSSVSNFKKTDNTKQKEIREKLNLPKNYIFYPAMYLPHKNHKGLIDSLKILRSNLKIDLKMVFSGSDSGYLNSLKKYAEKQNLSNFITFLNFVEDDYLPYLYLDAFVLTITPIKGPTFIPPWEGFKMGVPVVFSKLQGSREVYGDAVHYVDSLKPESIATGIKEIYESEELKQNLISNGKKKLNEIEARHEYKKIFKIIEAYRKIRETWEFDN